ncbi:ABC-three component system protein [Undibacterium sp. Tian12W]|uniref:ABC-three component system protein n=1 Tax=Undibacterium sp. Tian12W TaxID=3413054 RepID=UPI003BF286EB
MTTVSAGPKIVGYIYQFQRALYRLFSSQSPSIVIGIETDDDVVAVVKKSDGSVDIEFEQDKFSTQQSGHPFQDSGKNLWHTLHIWLDAIHARRGQTDSLIFCLVTNKEVTASAFARKLSEAKQEDEIANCIAEIRQRAKKIQGKALESAKAVASFTDEELGVVVRQLILLDKNGTVEGSDPKESTIQLFHLPEEISPKSNDIYQGVLGLLVDTCTEAWQNKKAVWIEKEPFARRLHAEINGCRMRKFVEQQFFSLDISAFLNNDTNDHLFLHQMRRFNAKLKDCNLALEHYWGFYSERNRLREEGNILPSEWDARNAELYGRWQQIVTNIELQGLTIDEISMAKAIYVETMDGQYQASLGHQKSTQWYFTAGNYHALANEKSSECYVHWHADFAKPEGDE